jgi:hypothetical protein
VFPRILLSGFPRFFLAVTCLALFTQTNWILNHRYYYDISWRLGGISAAILVLAPLLYILTALLLVPLRRRIADFFEWIAGIWTPLLVFSLHLLLFFGRVKGRVSERIMLVLFAFACVAWIVLQIRGWKSLPAPAAAPGPFFPALFRFVGTGFRDLGRIVFFPRWVMAPEPRSFLQPAAYPLLLAYCLVILFRGYALCSTPWDFPILLVSTFLSTVLLLAAIQSIAGPRKILLAFLNILLYVILGFFLIYHFNESVPFDFSLAWENRDILVDPDSFVVYAARVQKPVVIGLAVFIAWVAVLQRRAGLFSRPTLKKRSWMFAVSWLLLACLFVFTRLSTADEWFQFGRRIIPDPAARQARQQIAALIPEPFPYARAHFPLSPTIPRGKGHPDVFLVLMESFSRQWVEKRTPEGFEVTPVFNAHLKEGVFVDNFYGNTIQTSRALFVLFNGIYESLEAKTFHKYKNLLLRPLPVILEQAGYRNVFFNSHADINFDNKAFYLRKMGFEKLIPMTGRLIEGIPPEKFWNWGIQDDLFFDRSFRWLDENDPETQTGKRKPLFAVWLTLSQHRPHNRTPKNMRFVYPDAGDGDIAKHYANSEHLADMFLEEFFKQWENRPRYKDAIVILVSDHAYPIGFRSFNNEKGAFEENFRIPFLVIWKGKLAPRRIRDKAFNSTDVAPTILDLIGLDTPNQFIGASVFADTPQQSFCANQPYDKKYIAAYDFPYKYVKSLLMNTEELYNVVRDPEERKDLSQDPAYRTQLEQGRKTALQLIRNQVLLEQNRVWDPRLNPR